MSEIFMENLKLRLEKKLEKSRKRFWTQEEDKQLLQMADNSLTVHDISLNFPGSSVRTITRRIQRLRNV